MTTLTIEIDKEKDLQEVQAILTRMGLKFELEEDEDWGDVPEGAIEGIKAGLADIEAGRTHTHEEVMVHMQKKLASLRAKNG